MNPTANPAFPLALAAAGAEVSIVGAAGNRRSAHRLAELGLTPGVVLTVLRGDGGTLLIAVGDTRLAIGQGLAHTILVTTHERSGTCD
jgi:Fe2+ transport system protein FeoA